MTTLIMDVVVSQSEARFRNELLRTYFSAGEVQELSVTVRTLAPSATTAPSETAVIEFKRLLVLSFTGSMLIQLDNANGGSFEFTQQNGTLALPTAGRVRLTAAGAATLPRNIKYVAI